MTGHYKLNIEHKYSTFDVERSMFNVQSFFFSGRAQFDQQLFRLDYLEQ